MRNVNYYALGLLLSLLPLTLSAQDGWTETTSKDGKVKVKYKIFNEVDNTGDERMVTEYTATSTVKVDLNKAEKFLRNSENHKKVLDNTEVSKQVGVISENVWLQYLYIDIPWPMPNADCVQRVTLKRAANELIVEAIAEPDAYPMQDEKRMDISNMKYHFVEKSPGVIQLSITGRFSPIGSVNKFLMETWFPKGPAGLVERLVAQINLQ